jgi:PIN domain nuclease of toxin-antitoxin system
VIVLDTHAWIWWLDDADRLSDTARAAIAESPAIGISTLSAWELAMLVGRRRLSLDRDVRDWVRRGLQSPRVEAIAPEIDVAIAAATLGHLTFPGDPADRIIFATARSLGAPLVTKDARMRAFAPGETVW